MPKAVSFGPVHFDFLFFQGDKMRKKGSSDGRDPGKSSTNGLFKLPCLLNVALCRVRNADDILFVCSLRCI